MFVKIFIELIKEVSCFIEMWIGLYFVLIRLRLIVIGSLSVRMILKFIIFVGEYRLGIEK